MMGLVREAWLMQPESAAPQSDIILMLGGGGDRSICKRNALSEVNIYFYTV